MSLRSAMLAAKLGLAAIPTAAQEVGDVAPAPCPAPLPRDGEAAGGSLP